MAIKIKLKNSVTQDSVPTGSHLSEVGELALNANINSLGIYMRASDNSIVKMAGPGSVSTVAASTTVAGISEYATNAETTTGSSSTRTVTPAGLNAVTVAERSTSNSTYLALAGGTLTGVLAGTAGSNSAPSIHFGDSDSGIFGGTNTVSLAAGGTTRLTADTGVSVVGTLAVTGAITSTSDITLADKLIHSGDTNTAIRFPAADTVSIETGGSEALRVDGSQRLLVGTSTNLQSQTQKLQIAGTDANSAIIISRFSANNVAGYLHFQKSRNATIGGNTIVQVDDLLGRIHFDGNDGSGNETAAYIEAFVDGTPGSNDMPGRLVFSTTADGAASPTTRLTITSAGLVNVPDNGKFTAGASNDLQLFHDGTDSIISNSTNVLKTHSSHLYIRNAAGNEDIAKFIQDGPVELFHNNVKVFNTDGGGIQVRGPEGNNAYIYLLPDEGDDNADLWRFNGIAAGGFSLQNATSASWENNLEATGNGGVSLYFDNSLKFETTSTGITVQGKVFPQGGNLYLADSSAGGNGRATFGGGEDLQIWHDGTSSIIADNSAQLYIRANAAIKFQNDAVSETFAKFHENGNCELMYDNSKKFETTSTGTKFTQSLRNETDGADQGLYLGAGNDFRFYHDGSNNQIVGTGNHFIRFWTANTIRFNITNDGHFRPETNNVSDLGASNQRFKDLYISNDIDISDNGKLLLGDGDDLQLFHDGASYIDNTNGNLYIRSTNFIDLRGNGNETMIKGIVDGAVELYYNNTKKLETIPTGIQVSGANGAIRAVGSGEVSINIGSTNAGGAAIYFDGDSNGDWSGGDYGWIRHTTAGDMEICASNPADDGHVYLKVGEGTENGVITYAHAQSELYYDNSRKLRTTSTGGIFSGSWSMTDGNKMLFGTSDDLEIFHGSDQSWIKDNGAGNLILDTNGAAVQITSYGGGEHMAKFTKNGAVDLYYDNTLKLSTTTQGVQIDLASSDASGTPDKYLNIYNSNNGGNTMAGIRFATSSAANTDHWIYQKKHGSGNGTDLIVAHGSTERIRFIESGGITFNGDTAAANALDDWEEGTWTPTSREGTITVAGARYQKMGSLVWLRAEVYNFTTRSGTIDIGIESMPFTPAENGYGSAVFYKIAHTDEGHIATMANTSGRVQFLVSSQGGSEDWYYLDYEDLNNSASKINFSVMYRTTA